MAAITDFQSESRASTQASFVWTDNGEANTLKRAPHGGSYSTIATVTGLSSYIDSTVVAATYYDYKITSGVSGDSNVSSVTVQTCDAGTASPMSSVSLIPASGESVDPAIFNLAVDQLNTALQPRNDPNVPLVVCPTNKAVIIDCRTGKNFTILATTDINSISMIGCNGLGGDITIKIPPNVNRRICGFPLGFGMTGGECAFMAPGGSTGRSYSFPFSGTPTGPLSSMPGAGVPGVGGAGGGGGGGACSCQPTDGQSLTLVCCTASCSMNCAGGSPSLDVVACGGVPPYTFSITGTELTLTKLSSTSARITVPANNGSGVAGTAYRKIWADNACLLVPPTFYTWSQDYGCNNQLIGGCGVQSWGCNPGNPCTNVPVDGGCGAKAYCTSDSGVVHCTFTTSPIDVCDLRTPAMIAANCKPCPLLVSGQVVTVTDALGTAVSKTLTV